MDKRTQQQKAFDWQKEQTTQYNLRVMNATGIPEAVRRATKATGETTPQYLKNCIVRCLREDGFLSEQTEIVLNLNRHRHKQKLARLEKYLEQEKKKLNNTK